MNISCSCGNRKDFRSSQCFLCSNRSYQKGKTKISIEDVKLIIKKCYSFLELSKELRVSRRYITKLVRENNINYSHFKPCNNRPYTAENILIRNSPARPATVKALILKNKLLDYKCKWCGLGPKWNGKKITIQLDHINGNNKDNRIENLRFLCPNCHSQTSTYKGKNSKKRKGV